MKAAIFLCFTLLFSCNHLAAQDGPVPEEVGQAIGALAAASTFEAQLVVERVWHVDIANDELWRATRDLKASTGVMKNANKHLTASKPHFNEAEQSSMQEVVDLNNAVLGEMEALLEVLAAQGEGKPTTLAEAEFQSKRSNAIKLFVKLGFDERLFE